MLNFTAPDTTKLPSIPANVSHFNYVASIRLAKS